MLVDLTVEELDGVSDVRTDHVTGDTIVTFDDAKVSVDAIIDSIRGVGYDAEPVG
jgi:copper chaperone CopZ